MTAPDNPFFAQAMVNRTWAQLFGRGFVNPVDDMHDENEPSHPELLDALARQFATTGEFDVKYLVRAICLSRGVPADEQADRGQQGRHRRCSAT